MSLRRILYTSKLVLVFVLLCTIFRTAGSFGNIDAVLAPTTAKASVQLIRYEAKPSPKLSIEKIAQIIKKDPFGTSKNQASSSQLPLAASPLRYDSSFASQSGLTLMGTISGSRSVARAIIKNSETNTPDFYKIGQFVGDARIEGIEDDSVILFHHGQRKLLSITSWASNSHIQRNTFASSPTDTKKSKPVMASNVVPSRSETAIRKKMKSAQEILAKTTIKPYIVKGQNEGLQITGLENLTFAKKIGLKDGDVISAVNGHRLTSKQRAYQIFKKARYQKDLSLDLIRDDKPKNISFALR